CRGAGARLEAAAALGCDTVCERVEVLGRVGSPSLGRALLGIPRRHDRRVALFQNLARGPARRRVGELAMSQKNIEIVREAVEAWNRRDAELWLSYAAS